MKKAITGLIAIAGLLGLMVYLFFSEKARTPKEQWQTVIVTERQEIKIIGSDETKVVLKFSNGDGWNGIPSSTIIGEAFLFYKLEGDQVSFRYKSKDDIEFKNDFDLHQSNDN